MERTPLYFDLPYPILLFGKKKHLVNEVDILAHVKTFVHGPRKLWKYSSKVHVPTFWCHSLWARANFSKCVFSFQFILKRINSELVEIGQILMSFSVTESGCNDTLIAKRTNLRSNFREIRETSLVSPKHSSTQVY